jgi:hypothetical protein
MGVIKLTSNRRQCPKSEVRKQLVQPAGGFGGQRGLPRVFKQVLRRRFTSRRAMLEKFLTERAIDPTSP